MAIPKRRFSKLFLSILAVLIFLLGAMLITAYPRLYPTKQKDIESFVSNKILEWQTKYKDEKGLKVARIDIHFRPGSKKFSKGEGAVISPVGINLPGFQKIIDMASYPPAIRELPVDRITALAWPYTGKCRGHYHYVALCLVRQNPGQPINFNETPSFYNLPKAFSADALAAVKDLGEHNLHVCSIFPEWTVKTAGSGTYLEQFKRIVESVSRNIIISENRIGYDDVCASIRHSQFSPHLAHVATVMACRELQIPCYAFTAATDQSNHIVGTFSDHSGWIFFDMDKPEKGFFTDPPVLLTMAPLISPFQGSQHNYWYPEAAAYGGSSRSAYSLSSTKWGTENKDSNVTLAQTFNLGGNEK